MSSLIVGGVPIPIADFDEAEPTELGDRMETFAGGEMCSVRGAKRAWKASTRPLLDAEGAPLEAALAALGPVLCAGDHLDGELLCLVRIQEVPRVASRAASISFTLHEV